MIIYLNIDVVLFGSCSHVIMMTPKVDPCEERGVRNRVSLVKNSNDKSKHVRKQRERIMITDRAVEQWFLIFWTANYN